MTTEEACPYLHYRNARVAKNAGDYKFTGIVVGLIRKRSGVWRAVVENDDGILHIFSMSQLRLVGGDLDSLSIGDETP